MEAIEKKELLDKILISCEIKATDKIPEPLICLQVVDQNQELIRMGTLGNFSLVMGKAKSRKTFSISISVAAVLTRDIVLGKIKGTQYNGKEIVLYFDTEQDNYDVQRVINRICKMYGQGIPNNLKTYSLRQFSALERLELIEHAINNTENLGVVVIDGARDLVTSINDEQQASEIAHKLLKWTQEKQIHIIVALHQNKNDANARGHLGTELVNKAETVLSITKDSKNKDISIIDSDFCRGKDFEPFAFSINKEGIPEIVENWEADKKGKSKKIIPSELPPSLHKDIIDYIFEGKEIIQPDDFKAALKQSLITLCYPSGNDKVTEFLKFYKEYNFIYKQGNDKAPNEPYRKKT